MEAAGTNEPEGGSDPSRTGLWFDTGQREHGRNFAIDAVSVSFRPTSGVARMQESRQEASEMQQKIFKFENGKTQTGQQLRNQIVQTSSRTRNHKTVYRHWRNRLGQVVKPNKT